MRLLLDENLSLATTRILANTPFRHVSISDHLSDTCLISTKTKKTSYFFPLYIYNKNKEKSQQKNLNGETIESKLEKQPNFTNEFLEFIGKQYPNQKITPEEILGYIYAVLHSPTYRQVYEELLKIDFPRINFVKDFRSFKHLSELGTELINLHLMKTKLEVSTKFEKEGSNVVKFVKYRDKRVYINKEQFFDGISEEVWDFHVGSYQVLGKWLKSRKNRELSINEIEHFLQVIEIIKKTIEHMKRIDGTGT